MPYNEQMMIARTGQGLRPDESAKIGARTHPVNDSWQTLDLWFSQRIKSARGAFSSLWDSLRMF